MSEDLVTLRAEDLEVKIGSDIFGIAFYTPVEDGTPNAGSQVSTNYIRQVLVDGKPVWRNGEDFGTEQEEVEYDGRGQVDIELRGKNGAASVESIAQELMLSFNLERV